ncbi:hypothetical protein L208DRAFT_1411620 [Tricholoma matsutake]|nr:hypothetical protein L208DRAFT_1411620 [Tricholoma matsutake 945]
MTFIPGIGETGPLTGPLVLGYMLGCILVGVLSMQVHSYYNTFPNDRSWIKWLVGVVYGLEVVFTVFTLINAWAAFGIGWGDVHSLMYQHWSMVPLAPLNGIIASMVQFFFAYRIFKLTTNGVWLPIIICMISALQCAMVFYVGILNAVRGCSFKTFYELSTFISIWLAGDAVCDVLITISTVTILVKAVRRSRFRNTDTTLKRLIRLSVETGLITASGATVELILWQTQAFLNYHYIFFIILGKLYSNAMLAALNSRADNSSQGTSTDGTWNTHNQLSLFSDEHPETTSHLTLHGRPISIIRNVDVRRDAGLEMPILSSRDAHFGKQTKSEVSNFV